MSTNNETKKLKEDVAALRMRLSRLVDDVAMMQTELARFKQDVGNDVKYLTNRIDHNG